MKRGEIYYIEKVFQTTGSEQLPGRPAIIVSNDKCNENSDVLEVVYLTTRPKADLPTHVDIRSSERPSIALCEQVSSISVSRFGSYIGVCSEYEMQMVDAALEISLGLNTDYAKVAKPEPEHKQALPLIKKNEFEELNLKLLKAQTERDTFKALYSEMLERMVTVR